MSNGYLETTDKAVAKNLKAQMEPTIGNHVMACIGKPAFSLDGVEGAVIPYDSFEIVWSEQESPPDIPFRLIIKMGDFTIKSIINASDSRIVVRGNAFVHIVFPFLYRIYRNGEQHTRYYYSLHSAIKEVKEVMGREMTVEEGQMVRAKVVDNLVELAMGLRSGGTDG